MCTSHYGLMQLCEDFHRIITSMPMFWSFVSNTLPRSPETGSTPLTSNVWFTEGSFVKEIDSILRGVVSHMDGWETFNLDMFVDSF